MQNNYTQLHGIHCVHAHAWFFVHVLVWVNKDSAPDTHANELNRSLVLHECNLFSSSFLDLNEWMKCEWNYHFCVDYQLSALNVSQLLHSDSNTGKICKNINNKDCPVLQGPFHGAANSLYWYDEDADCYTLSMKSLVFTTASNTPDRTRARRSTVNHFSWPVIVQRHPNLLSFTSKYKSFTYVSSVTVVCAGLCSNVCINRN